MAKNPKAKVPKKVAGLKVPKAFRKLGALDALVGTPIGREVLAGALIAAAAAAANALRQHAPSAAEIGEAGKAVGKAGSDAASAAGDITRTAAAALAGVVADAAQALRPTAPKKKAEPRRANGGGRGKGRAPAATGGR